MRAGGGERLLASCLVHVLSTATGAGGQLVLAGTPEQLVAGQARSHTGRALEAVLARGSQPLPAGAAA